MTITNHTNTTQIIQTLSAHAGEVTVSGKTVTSSNPHIQKMINTLKAEGVDVSKIFTHKGEKLGKFTVQRGEKDITHGQRIGKSLHDVPDKTPPATKGGGMEQFGKTMEKVMKQAGGVAKPMMGQGGKALQAVNKAIKECAQQGIKVTEGAIKNASKHNLSDTESGNTLTSSKVGTDSDGKYKSRPGGLSADLQKRIISGAQDFVDRKVPYVWGGNAADGADCSGMVQYIYGENGISIPHYSGAQFDMSSPCAWEDMAPGNPIFYGDGGSQHVAIFAGYDGDTPMMYEEQQTGLPALLSPVRDGAQPRQFNL